MRLERIISLANVTVRHRFLAMERSLRAVGCDLPLDVIPYDDRRFDLPPNSSWLEDAEFFAFLAREGARPVSRKYLCLTRSNYQFVDADVVFLRDPREVLAPVEGFVISCVHWRDPHHVLTPELEAMLRRRTTVWRQWLFNSGQFACDRALYSVTSLQAALLEPASLTTALQNPYHEQPGMNWLVLRTGVAVTSLMLQPHLMESTWAGDYPGDYLSYWKNPRTRPYLIHWAGLGNREDRPIDRLYLEFLTQEEQRQWREQRDTRHRRSRRLGTRMRGWAVRFRKGLRAFAKAWSE